MKLKLFIIILLINRKNIYGIKKEENITYEIKENSDLKEKICNVLQEYISQEKINRQDLLKEKLNREKREEILFSLYEAHPDNRLEIRKIANNFYKVKSNLFRKKFVYDEKKIHKEDLQYKNIKIKVYEILTEYFNSIEDFTDDFSHNRKILREKFNVNIRNNILKEKFTYEPYFQEEVTIQKISNDFYKNKLNFYTNNKNSKLNKKNEDYKEIRKKIYTILTNAFNSIDDFTDDYSHNQKILKEKFNGSIRNNILKKKGIYKAYPENKDLIKEASNNFYINKSNLFKNNLNYNLAKLDKSIFDKEESYISEKENLLQENNKPIPTNIFMDED